MAVAVGQWDEWRTAYPTMSLDEHRDYYDRIHGEFPSQRHYDLGALLDWIDQTGIRSVVELGGWNGELAAAALHLRPSLTEWTNYEICAQAVDNSVPRDERFQAVLLEDWFWNLDAPADCFVASHTIEHLSAEHFEALASRLSQYPYLFLDAPLHPESRTVWQGFTGTHILPFSWQDVTELLDAEGFDLTWTHWRYSVHCYTRR